MSGGVRILFIFAYIITLMDLFLLREPFFVSFVAAVTNKANTTRKVTEHAGIVFWVLSFGVRGCRAVYQPSQEMEKIISVFMLFTAVRDR